MLKPKETQRECEFKDGSVAVHARVITKDDGRYLIFYTFEEMQKPDREEGRNAQPAANVRSSAADDQNV